MLLPLRCRTCFDALYETYASPRYLDPDPVLFLHRYDTPEDVEVAGLLAACFAYGKVRQIQRSVEILLNILGPEPSSRLVGMPEEEFVASSFPLRHRFTDPEETVALLRAIRLALRRYGGLESLFREGMNVPMEGERKILHANRSIRALRGVTSFVRVLTQLGAVPPGRNRSSLLASPEKGSACKRLFLFLKWMVRRDAIDPGRWTCLHPSELVLPLDTHMFALCSAWGFCERRHPDLAAALEATRVFREINPEDPLRYDFVLTRFGIRPELSMEELCRKIPDESNEGK